MNEEPSMDIQMKAYERRKTEREVMRTDEWKEADTEARMRMLAELSEPTDDKTNAAVRSGEAIA